jgi:exodeoxyribonuclease III
VRLVAWNCARGLARKFDALLSLRPHVAVLSEIACPAKLQAKVRQVCDLPIVWIGDNPNMGLAVISFAGSQLVLDGSCRSTNRYIAPVRVIGQYPFRLLAVWDHNDRKEGLNKRPGPLLRALDDSAEFCQDNDFIVAGDFNNNPRWDRPNGPNNMARIVEELTKRGLVSLYHHKTKEAFGDESFGTYWHHRVTPYHIDYIFVPKSWLTKFVSFEVGSFEAWCRAGLSDHAPLVAEFR